MKKKDILIITVAGLIAAGAGLYIALHKRANAGNETPPPGAPQLDIENPGDQSEFLSASSEESQLG